jgi:AcrR family transcriptional regulator
VRDEVRTFKRSRIVAEASRLFFERGYELTNVDDIATGLSVSKPFIYSLFPHKLAILQAVYAESAERLLGKVKLELERQGSPASRLESLVKTFVGENIEHQVASGIFLQEEKHLPPDQLAHVREVQAAFDHLLADLVRAGIAAGEFAKIDAHLASLSISGMVRWVHRWYRPDGRLSRVEIESEMARLVLNLVGYRR